MTMVISVAAVTFESVVVVVVVSSVPRPPPLEEEEDEDVLAALFSGNTKEFFLTAELTEEEGEVFDKSFFAVAFLMYSLR